MRYNIIGKNIDVWDKTKEMVEKKLDRIAKLFPEDTNATITLSLEKLVSTVEVTIPLNKRLIRAEVQDTDMTAAMDKAVDILENQVVRYKKRMRTKVRQGGENFVAEYQAIMVPEEDLDEEPLYKIERIKHFEVKPMDAEEAVMEMELIGHNFFVFRNGETDEVNVVYKRKNGSYGLIEPEYRNILAHDGGGKFLWRRFRLLFCMKEEHIWNSWKSWRASSTRTPIPLFLWITIISFGF